jgi:hypothetical protein
VQLVEVDPLGLKAGEGCFDRAPHIAAEGFIEIGRRPRYYQPDDVDAVVMKLDLRTRAAAAASDPTDAGACT